LRIAAIVYVAYLAITLLVISPALNILPHRYMQNTYGWELRTGWVLLNPFKVSLDISEAELSDATGEPFLAFSEATANLSLASLWRSGWVLDAVNIRDLYLTITRLTEDEYNFSDLLPDGTTEDTPEQDDGEIPGITIRDLDLHSETIALNDLTRKIPYSSRWNGLHIRVMNISTVGEEGRPYIVDLKGDGGGKLHWVGEISLPAGTSQGHLSVSNLNLRKLWEFSEPWLNFELRDGRLAMEGDYQLNWSDVFSYSISEGHIGLSSIDIVPMAPDQLPDTAVALQTLDIDNIALNSTTQQVTVDSFILDGLAVATWREGSAISLQPLFALSLPADSPDESNTDVEADAPGWTVALNLAQLQNSSLRWRSQLTDPAQLDVQPISATIENIHWPLSGETRLSLNLAVNEQAKIAVNGALALAEGNGTINYALDGLPLAWFNPNLPTALKASITSGQVQVEGKLALQDYAPTTVTLNGVISEFAASLEDVETILTGWDAVRFEGLSVDMVRHSLVLEKLIIDRYTGRLHINEDGSINASNIWKEEVGEQVEQVVEDLTEDKPWSFSIPTIRISDSSIDFMDQSLPIQFRTVIGELEGEIVNLSSEPNTAATVNIQGSVDGYAPVALKGEVSSFVSPVGLDLNLTFDGIDMARLSPYTSTYAGYAIDQGLLDLHLNYALKENQLRGNNAIRIDKLKLGEKVSSDKAVDLPLKLALAILTDSNGVIDMQVPVTGDVNDPGFALGGVIGKAFVNIITKAITAPFTLLANLVGSEEDLQRITFPPGSTQLTEVNTEKLTHLSEALQQRPGLSLLITGRLNLTTDRERLQKNALKVQLLEEGVPEEEINTKGPDWEEAIGERYEELPIETPDPLPTLLEQYSIVAQSIDIPDDTILELAQERAVAVKRYLLNETQLVPERAVIGQAGLDDEENIFSGVELSIED